MANLTRKYMQKVLEHGVEIRNRYFFDNDDPISSLSKGASEVDILEVEEKTGYILPESYRLFLSVSDGWNYVDANISLMSCSEIKTALETKSFSNWCTELRKYNSSYPKNALVIGRADMGDANYLLVLPDRNKDTPAPSQADWPIMYISSSTDYIYINFMEFVEQSRITYQELVEGEENQRVRHD